MRPSAAAVASVQYSRAAAATSRAGPAGPTVDDDTRCIFIVFTDDINYAINCFTIYNLIMLIDYIIIGIHSDSVRMVVFVQSEQFYMIYNVFNYFYCK